MNRKTKKQNTEMNKLTDNDELGNKHNAKFYLQRTFN